MARRVPLSPELYQKIINSETFQREVSAYQSTTGIEGRKAQDDVANLVYRTFYRPSGVPKLSKRMSVERGRPLARFLERIGLREKNAPYPVGKTPKKKR